MWTTFVFLLGIRVTVSIYNKLESVTDSTYAEYTLDIEAALVNGQYTFTISLNGSFPVVRWTDTYGAVCDACPSPSTFTGEYAFMTSQQHYLSILASTFSFVQRISVTYTCLFEYARFDCIVRHILDDRMLTYSPYTDTTTSKGDVTGLYDYRKGCNVSSLITHAQEIKERWWKTLLVLRRLGQPSNVMVEFWSEDHGPYTTCIVTSPSVLRLTVTLVESDSPPIFGDIDPTLNGFVATAASVHRSYHTCIINSSIGWSVVLSPPERARHKRPVDEYNLFTTTCATKAITRPVSRSRRTTVRLIVPSKRTASLSTPVIVAVSFCVVLGTCILGFFVWIVYKRITATRANDEGNRSRAYARGSTIKNSFRFVRRKQYV